MLKDSSSPYDPDPEQASPSDRAAGWDTEADVVCPYCGEAMTIGVDPGGGLMQAYVEDCQVCCRPWQVHLRYDSDGVATIELEVT